MAATDFFTNIGDFREHVISDEVPAATPIGDLDHAFRQPELLLINLISQGTYTSLKDYYNRTEGDAVSEKDTAVGYIQGALANLVAQKLFILNAADRNERKMYRYQEDQILDLRIENAWANLDLLLNHMEKYISKFAGYTDTQNYKIREELIIKSATEFSRWYGINNSAYFFNRCTPKILEVQDRYILPTIDTVDNLTGNDKLERVTKRAIVYLTMARVAIDFEFTDLPKPIRADIVKERAGSKGKENEVKLMLSRRFELEAGKYLSQIDLEMKKVRESENYITPPGEIQSEDDPFYLMT